MLVGALLQTALSLSAWPFRRCSGVRGQLADTWRTLAVLSSGKPRDLPVTPAARPTCAHRHGNRLERYTRQDPRLASEHSGCCADLAPAVGIYRSRRLELEERDPGCQELADLDDFAHAVSRFSRAMATGLVALYRSRALPGGLGRCAVGITNRTSLGSAQVDAATAACEAAARASKASRVPNRPPWARDLPTEHGSPRRRRRSSVTSYIGFNRSCGTAFWMAIIIPVARIVGLWALTEHQYWVALTVAWVT